MKNPFYQSISTMKETFDELDNYHHSERNQPHYFFISDDENSFSSSEKEIENQTQKNILFNPNQDIEYNEMLNNAIEKIILNPSISKSQDTDNELFSVDFDYENIYFIGKLEKKKELIGKKRKGRKLKDSLDEGTHNAYSEDNVITKIKTFVLNKVAIPMINFKSKYKFFKISVKGCTSCITKEVNKELMDKTLKDILKENPSSTKNKVDGKKNKNHNKETVEKIFSEEKENESEARNFLNLTYRQILESFINGKFVWKYSLEGYKEYLRGDNKIKDFEKYWEIVERLTKNFEGWFDKKTERSTKKKTIKNSKIDN